MQYFARSVIHMGNESYPLPTGDRRFQLAADTTAPRAEEPASRH